METKEQTSRVCVSVAHNSSPEVLEIAKRIEPLADVIELRLDWLEKIELSKLLETIKKPLLFTNRPTWEGGKFSGHESKRIQPLLASIWLEKGYVDLELKAPADSLYQLMDAKARSSTKLIMSSHDFEKTPPRQELLDTMQEMIDKGADIGKIVTTARNYHDVLRVLNLQETAAVLEFPLIAFCMGRPGVISRLATMELGGYMTYCAADENMATAPGQLSVRKLRALHKNLVSDDN